MRSIRGCNVGGRGAANTNEVLWNTTAMHVRNPAACGAQPTCSRLLVSRPYAEAESGTASRLRTKVSTSCTVRMSSVRMRGWRASGSATSDTTADRAWPDSSAALMVCMCWICGARTRHGV